MVRRAEGPLGALSTAGVSAHLSGPRGEATRGSVLIGFQVTRCCQHHGGILEERSYPSTFSATESSLEAIVPVLKSPVTPLGGLSCHPVPSLDRATLRMAFPGQPQTSLRARVATGCCLLFRLMRGVCTGGSCHAPALASKLSRVQEAPVMSAADLTPSPRPASSTEDGILGTHFPSVLCSWGWRLPLSSSGCFLDP